MVVCQELIVQGKQLIRNPAFAEQCGKWWWSFSQGQRYKPLPFYFDPIKDCDIYQWQVIFQLASTLSTHSASPLNAPQHTLLKHIFWESGMSPGKRSCSQPSKSLYAPLIAAVVTVTMIDIITGYHRAALLRTPSRSCPFSSRPIAFYIWKEEQGKSPFKTFS